MESLLKLKYRENVISRSKVTCECVWIFWDAYKFKVNSSNCEYIGNYDWKILEISLPKFANLWLRVYSNVTNPWLSESRIYMPRAV